MQDTTTPATKAMTTVSLANPNRTRVVARDDVAPLPDPSAPETSRAA